MIDIELVRWRLTASPVKTRKKLLGWNYWVGGVGEEAEVLTGLELRAGKARLERFIPGMVSSKYLTTAETDVSRSAAQTRARR